MVLRIGQPLAAQPSIPGLGQPTMPDATGGPPQAALPPMMDGSEPGGGLSPEKQSMIEAGQLLDEAINHLTSLMDLLQQARDALESSEQPDTTGGVAGDMGEGEGAGALSQGPQGPM